MTAWDNSTPSHVFTLADLEDALREMRDRSERWTQPPIEILALWDYDWRCFHADYHARYPAVDWWLCYRLWYHTRGHRMRGPVNPACCAEHLQAERERDGGEHADARSEEPPAPGRPPGAL